MTDRNRHDEYPDVYEDVQDGYEGEYEDSYEDMQDINETFEDAQAYLENVTLDPDRLVVVSDELELQPGQFSDVSYIVQVNENFEGDPYDTNTQLDTSNSQRIATIYPGTGYEQDSVTEAFVMGVSLLPDVLQVAISANEQLEAAMSQLAMLRFLVREQLTRMQQSGTLDDSWGAVLDILDIHDEEQYYDEYDLLPDIDDFASESIDNSTPEDVTEANDSESLQEAEKEGDSTDD